MARDYGKWRVIENYKPSPLVIQIKRRTCCQTTFNLRKPTGSTKNLALSWNLQEGLKMQPPIKTWKRTL
jgi:hypothetical protein